MNKITNISIVDDFITFYIYTNLSIVNTNDFVIYVDDSCNYINVMNSDPKLHDYVFDYTNSKIKSRELIEDGDPEEVTVLHLYEISVQSDLIKDMDYNMKYFKMFHVSERFANDYSEGVYYSDLVLYDAEIRTINSYCSTCLDDKLMLLIMLVTFKRLLLESAIKCGDNITAMRLYQELLSLLNVTVSRDTVTSGVCNSCSKPMKVSCGLSGVCSTGNCNGNYCSLSR